MRLVVLTVVVVAGALLVAVGEVARSFSSKSKAGDWAAMCGSIFCVLGLMGVFVELYAPA
jgi:hypothetical protein